MSPERPRARERRAAGALAACLSLAVGCVPALGPLGLPPVSGRVADLQTGQPVAGAEVVEWYVGGGASDGARPVHHARWATTRADGTFLLDESRTSPRMWFSRSYGPKFAFVHPDYGLQRQARQEGEGWLLLGDRRRLEQAQQDLRPFCREEYADAGAQRIREVACVGFVGRPLR